MKEITLIVPDNWRIGQYIFNLLEFIRNEKLPSKTPGFDIIDSEINPDFKTTDRLYDTFHIQDDEMNNLINAFNNQYEK